MYAQVRDIIARCEQCDSVRTSFSSRQFILSPLPIQGMFYCWSCDLVGELPQTSRGNVYIMIMIEHFSKWVELVVLLDKSSHNTSHVFLQQVLCRFYLALPYITMGYKMSKHTSLSHFSLYFLLFGRHPIPPSSIVAQMDQVVDLDSPTTWARVIAKRDALFRRVMPMAMENLSIAQHRDTLRYAHI